MMNASKIPADVKTTIAADMKRIRTAMEFAEASYDSEMMARAVRAYANLCDTCASIGLPCPASFC